MCNNIPFVTYARKELEEMLCVPCLFSDLNQFCKLLTGIQLAYKYLMNISCYCMYNFLLSACLFVVFFKSFLDIGDTVKK